MGQVGPKMRMIGPSSGLNDGGLAHWCPGCEEMHGFSLDGPNWRGARWTWDQNITAPTFTPSMLIKWGKHSDPKCEDPGGVCHYIVTAGQISFLPDSTHALSGKTVAMPDLPDFLTDEGLTCRP